MIRSRNIGFVVLWGLLLAFLVPVQAQEFKAFLGQKTVAPGETFQVSFRLENAQGSNWEWPDFSPLQVIGGPNSSTSMQFINGQMSQAVTYSFYLRANEAGEFKIGAAAVTVDGDRLTTEPLTITVTNQGSQSGTSGDGSGSARANQGDADLQKQIADLVFIRAIPSKRRVYQGEQFTLTYKLFYRLNITGLEPGDPSLNGFWVENIPIQEYRPRVEAVDGVRHNAVVFRKAILFPQRSGNIRIDPIEAKTTVQIANNNRRRSIFDGFFDSYRQVPFVATSPAVSINVTPLPRQGRPASFNGAVGQYDMSLQLDREQTETGEPVTLTMRITGQGNLRNIEAPRLEFPPDFDVFDPKAEERISTKNATLSGSKTWSWLIVPRNPGEYKLPAPSFSWFDPVRETYRSQPVTDLKLTVTGEPQGSGPAIAGNIGKEDVELIGQDIRYIKTGDVSWVEADTSFAGSGAFWGLLLLPLALLGGLVVWQRRQQALAADVAGTRSRKAEKMARKRLQQAEKLSSGSDRKAFYDEVTKAVWGYLGDRLGIAPSDLNRQKVEGELTKRGVDESSRKALVDLLDKAEMAIYAPAGGATELPQAYQQALDLIGRLEEQLGK